MGACIVHPSPEALAVWMVGRLGDGVLFEIMVDWNSLEGSVNLVGHGDESWGSERGTQILAARQLRSDLTTDPDLPDDTRLWAALQEVSGGTWGGCVYDVELILQAIE